MRIAVASTGKKADSKVDDQAGRAPFYLVFDETGNLIDTLKNPFSRGGGGAGFGVAKMLADRQVSVVVAGRFGEKMISALQGRGLRAYEHGGGIEEALGSLRKEQEKGG